MEPIIEIKNLGKKYNINHQKGGYIALRDILTDIGRNPLKFLKKKAKQLAGFEKKEEFWALKDVNFDVAPGEVLGIIGHNGAGKSTLLKILSQITPPTTGSIKIKGRIGSLLEVGTGFHPELSGRENIFLNGAILGMERKEIANKFDMIVEFAGIGKFLDTPVKYYSSGMYVRLAFSVAAHMDPEILLVDEVLAVGDAEFQKKCLGKMEEVTKAKGRTILFVSHNIEAIKKLCNKCVLLQNGAVVEIGETEMVVEKYLKLPLDVNKGVPASERKRKAGLGQLAKIVEVKVITGEGENLEIVDSTKPITFEFKVDSSVDDLDCGARIVVRDELQNLVFMDSGKVQKKFFKLQKGENIIKCHIDELSLYSGNYKVSFGLITPNTLHDAIDFVDDAFFFSVQNFDPYNTGYNLERRFGFGIFNTPHRWE
jgi:lipopolysaccharide transport system ATP-binding protein